MEWITLTKKTRSNDPKEKKGGKHSLFAILFSVFVALTLWFYVQDAETPDYKKTFTSIPVEMQSLSSVFSVIEGGENTVDITLVGKRSDLNKIKTSDLSAYLDLSGITQSGSYEPSINVLLPEGTELQNCFPKKANIFVDQTVSVSVPVEVELGSYTAPDSIVIEATPVVEEISVKGPESVLDQVHHAKVITGDLGEITGSFERNIEYALYNENGQLIESRHVLLPERNLKVRFSVYQTKLVPLTVRGLNGWWKESDMKYTVSPSGITIKGEPSVVAGVESVSALILDETTLDGTRYSTTLTPSQLSLPQGVSLGETVGDISVNLTLSNNGSKMLKMALDSNHVAVTAPRGELTYEFVDTEVNFKVRGNYESVGNADVSEFYLNIDLSEISTPGEKEIPVQIVQTSASEGKYYPVGSYTVKVMVK